MKISIPLVLSIVLLSGCASYEPTNIALNPQLGAVTLHTEKDTPVTVSTFDTRQSTTVMRITEKGEANKMYGTYEPLTSQLDVLFKRGMARAGYEVSPSAVHSIKFQLHYLMTEVIDTTFDYEAKTKLVINLIASNGTQELSKSFSGSSSMKAPLSPDIADIELQINQLITKLSSEALNDAELHDFLQR